MREIISINENWIYSGEGISRKVSLPHIPGETGVFTYSRDLEPVAEGEVMLEISGADSLCNVYIDGAPVFAHKGGAGAFRYDITNYIRSGCTLTLFADNTGYEDIYPVAAGLKPIGGVAGAKLIVTGLTRFSCTDYSSDGLYLTPFIKDGKAFLGIKALVDCPAKGSEIKYALLDRQGKTIAEETVPATQSVTVIDCGKPKHGKDGKPYLYTLKAEIIITDGSISDCLSIKTCFDLIEAEGNNLTVNGKLFEIKVYGGEYEPGAEDEFIASLSGSDANTLLLQNYQLTEKLLDYCDENGIFVIASIPVIPSLTVKKQKSYKSQFTEMIKQNYNRPCIPGWCVGGNIVPDLPDEEKRNAFVSEINSLIKSIDSLRYSRFENSDMPGKLTAANEALPETAGRFINEEDTLGDIVDSADIKELFHSRFGTAFDFIFAAAGPLKRFGIKPVLDTAKTLGLPEEYLKKAEEYLKSLRKQ